MATLHDDDSSLVPNEEETTEVVDELMEQEGLDKEDYDCFPIRGKMYVAEVSEREREVRGSGDQVNRTSYNTDEVYIVDPKAGVNGGPALREAEDPEIQPLYTE